MDRLMEMGMAEEAVFDKSAEEFPIKKKYDFLSYCSVSPLYSKAFEKVRDLCEAQRDRGLLVFEESYVEILERLRESASALLRTSPDNLSFVKNTSEAMSMIANGYPFDVGDQVVSYEHEYPANHYPWRLQERRGVEIRLLPDVSAADGPSAGGPRGWSMEDLEATVTGRTRIVAVSHVQFASGFAADLKILGGFCRERQIDLVLDGAQSLGCLPLYPEERNVAAVASSGWKWLMGPVGSGLLYTSESFREKLGHTMVGAELMAQGTDYLNHDWDPRKSGKRFEYSTSPASLASALDVCIRNLFLKYGLEAIRGEIFRLQDLFLASLDRDRYSPVSFPEPNRSGILAVSCREDPAAVVAALRKENIICTTQGGYLRVAPHFSTTDDEITRASSTL